MRLAVAVLISFTVLALAVPAAAQRTTGEIVGKVSDASGGVLPGVTVTLRGPALQGEQVDVTTASGQYRFPVVPAGTYELEYALSGFTTIKVTDILIVVGQTAQLDQSLKVGAVEENITVSGASPVVDLSTSQVSTAYNQEWVQSLPVRRFSYFDIINSAPGVQQNSQLGTSVTATVFGSSNNQYQVDGTVIGSNPWLNTDAIDTAQVLSLGASAEYGNVQGAVFNIVTRQGGNQLHGDANYYFQHNSLVGRNTSPDFDKGNPYHLDKYWDGTLQVGGPFITDRFWFFGSTEFNGNDDSQPNTDPKYPAKSEERRMFWKFTYSINNNHRLLNGYHDDFYWLPAVGTQFNAPSTLSRSHGHNPTPNVVYTGVLTNKTLLETRFSGIWLRASGEPQIDGQSPQGVRYTDGDTQLISGAITSYSAQRTWTYGTSAKLTHTIDQFLGSTHDINTGVQYANNGNETFTGTNDSIKFFGTSGKQATGTTKLPQIAGTNSISWGAYVDDTVRVGARLTLNLGVRYDHSRGFYPAFPLLDAFGNQTGQMSAANNDVDHFNTWSPRLGANFQLFERTLIKAHYGRYYDQIPRDFGSQVPSTTASVSFNCLGQPADPANAGGFCTDPASRSNFTQTAASNNTMDPHRRNDYTDQVMFQVEQALSRDLGLQVNYVHKHGKDLVGTIETAGTYVQVPYVDTVGVGATGNTINVWKLTSSASNRVFMLSNPAGLYSNYNGVVIVLNKRMSHHWSGVVSADFSKSTTNENTVTSSGLPTATNFGQSPNDYLFSDGLSLRDRPFVGKAQLSFQLPWRFMATMNAQHQSGEPYQRTIQISGLGFPTVPTIAMEPLDGRRRFPSLNQVDARLMKEFRLSGARRLQVFVDALNLFNTDKSESVGSTIGSNSSFAVPTNFIPPRHVQLGTKFVW
jgi:hypothetical protein